MKNLTAEQLLRRIEDLRRMAAGPVGDHLTDQEAIEYCAGSSTEPQRSPIEDHLDSCGACCRDVDVLSHLDYIEKERRLLTWLSDQILLLQAPLRKLADDLKQSSAVGEHEVRPALRLPLALSGELRPMFEGQAFGGEHFVENSTPDQRLRWRIVDEGPQVVVTFDSDVEDLVDMPTIRLHFGDAVEGVVFAKCAGRIVGTSIFTKAHLGAWRGTDVIQLEVEGLDEDAW
ncbi:MAG: hypothetical protein AABO58_07650 [Acidobacteriota bacterium]